MPKNKTYDDVCYLLFDLYICQRDMMLWRLTVRRLVGEQRCQSLVLLLLWQQWDGQVGPHPHRVVRLLLLSYNFLLRLHSNSNQRRQFRGIIQIQSQRGEITECGFTASCAAGSHFFIIIWSSLELILRYWYLHWHDRRRWEWRCSLWKSS